MQNLMFSEELDFLEKDVDLDVVLKSAAVVGINPDHKHYGWVLEVAERGGFEDYKDLFEAIKETASKRSKEWGSLEMPTPMMDQHHLWMSAIHRGIEGTQCALCGSHGCSH